MELAEKNLIKIAMVSQELGKVLAGPNVRGVCGPDGPRFRSSLDKILATSREILEILNRCTITDSSSPIDERLERWISENGPVICSMALDEIKRIINNLNHSEVPLLGVFSARLAFGRTKSCPADKIAEALRILDDRQYYFSPLFVSGVWNHEISMLSQTSADFPIFQQANSSECSLGRKNIQYRKQGWMGVRSGDMDANCYTSYGSFNPSQETVVDKYGDEQCDHFSIGSGTASLESIHYSSNTESYLPTHKRWAIPHPAYGTGSDTKATRVNYPTGNVLRKTRNAEKVCKNDVDLEKLDGILQWLDAFRCFERHRATLSQRQADTCAWLPETNEYRRWMAREDSFLWLHGKAGCGKSVLIASVIERLEKTRGDEPLAFFYCDFGKERSMDATEVIRSVLFQLVDQYRNETVKLGALQVVDELMEERRKGDTGFKDVTYLSSLASRVAGQFSQPPLVVIDALDECNDVAGLLHALLMLIKTKGVGLFVSSRPIHDIKYRFSGLPCISVDKMANAVSADIKLHVSREIDSHPRLGFLDPVLKKKIHSTLCQKADGMFRWVQCQLDTLKRCFTLPELHQALNNLPTGLDSTYERILLAIDQRPSEAKVAQRTLAWLVTTSRPLVLREVIEALSIDLQRRILDRSNAPIHKYALLDALGSLVVHEEETDIINLSHFSVKEYLTNEFTRKKMPTYHISLREAHKQVFQLCMFYLVASLNHPFEDDETPQSRPLVDYVFSCGFDHLTHLEPTDDVALHSMRALQSEIQNHPLEWARMCQLASLYHPYKSWITPEHDFIICVLISMFPEPFLRAFLRRAPRKAKYASNPLVHTVQFDKVDHARTLLSHGIDVNGVGWDILDDGLRRDFKSPLEAALRRENSVFVDLLLKEGSATISRRVYSIIFDGPSCAYPPHFVSSLLQADEFMEWAGEVQDAEFLLRSLSRNRYGQHQVTDKDLLAMTRRLVQIERDISPLDSSKQILLIVALVASEGHLPLLEYLFSIDAPIPSGVLVAEETASLVRDLTHRGLNVKALAIKGDTSLHRVLRGCKGGSCCWVLDCNLCSAFRSTLLAALGRESAPQSERILIKILTTSRELITGFVDASSRKIGNPDTPRVSSQLKKIILASGTLLQAMNKSFLDNSSLDHRSERWISGKEPKACLDVLQQMAKLVRIDKPDETVADVEGANRSQESYLLCPDDKINDAITLFNKQENCFRFLLLADLDKSKVDSERLPRKNDSIIIPGVDQGVGVGGRDINQPCQSIRFTAPDVDQSEEEDAPDVKQIRLPRKHRHTNEPSSSYRGPDAEIDVIFVGPTGVGKSSLINMIRGVPDHSAAAAKVSNDIAPCTAHTTSYACSLQTGLHCRLWDTRGLDEAPVGAQTFMIKLVDKIRQLASQQARELRETLRDRTKLGVPILVWCIDAAKIVVDVPWQQFHKVYVEFCERKAIPVVVITRGPPMGAEWDRMYARCTDQLRELYLRVDVPLIIMRRYRNPSSIEYIEDSTALRNLIAELASRSP